MSQSVNETMITIGEAARAATRKLAIASSESKSLALMAAATTLRDQLADVLRANEADMENGRESGLSQSMLDRLLLNEERVEGIAQSLEAIAVLPDPVGEVIAEWDRPNGLSIQRVRTPLGVIGVIYESRPNVTADAGALCLKAGNAVILRGGSDSFQSSRAIHACMKDGLIAAGLPETSIQMVPTTDRAAVGEMLAGLNGNLDVLVPRGGKSLVSRVQQESRVPVFAHLEGICHVYVDHEADMKMAMGIVINSKMRRTGICGAAESLLLDKRLGNEKIEQIVQALQETGCEIRADETIGSLVENCVPVTEEDWSTEFLDAMISAKVVAGVEEAIEHIGRYSSHHTESIVTDNAETAAKFMNEIDSAILLHNASTQFADGGEFGMGAEIGIATGKMHARGPVGVEQLTSFNYRVTGNGQVRS